jgi:hypothetical protein
MKNVLPKNVLAVVVVVHDEFSSSSFCQNVVFRPNNHRDFSPTGARRLSRERGRMKKMEKNDRQQV